MKTKKIYSDRGSLSDLVNRLSNQNIFDEVEPSPYELRIKKLYEFAELHKNNELKDSLGFVTTDYISDKNALPLSIYRLREIVSSLKAKPNNKINELTNELSACFGLDVISNVTVKNKFVKLANKLPFRRVSDDL